MIRDITFPPRRSKINTITSLASVSTKSITEKRLLSSNTTFPTKKLEVTFREDYDITNIHRIILNKIKFEFDKCKNLLDRIDSLKQLINNTELTIVEKSTIKNKISKLENKHTIRSDPNRLIIYKNKASEYIDAYRSIPSSRHVIDIMDKNGNRYIPEEEDINRINVIKEYIRFAKNYIKIDMTCTGYKASVSQYRCDNCNEDLRDITIESDSCIICPNCSELKYIRGVSCSVDAESDGSLSNNSSYEDTVNFVKALHKYQGKLIPKLDMEDIIRKLDIHFNNVKFPHRDDIRKLVSDNKGKKPGTSITIMLSAMSSMGIKCYSEIHYICHIYWGWEFNDLSRVEDIIIEDYKKTQEVWYKIPQFLKGRKSSIPIWYRVLQHLRLRGQMVDETDFKIPKNVGHYNCLWKMMCDGANDINIYYIPL